MILSRIIILFKLVKRFNRLGTLISRDEDGYYLGMHEFHIDEMKEELLDSLPDETYVKFDNIRIGDDDYIKFVKIAYVFHIKYRS